MMMYQSSKSPSDDFSEFDIGDIDLQGFVAPETRSSSKSHCSDASSESENTYDWQQQQLGSDLYGCFDSGGSVISLSAAIADGEMTASIVDPDPPPAPCEHDDIPVTISTDWDTILDSDVLPNDVLQGRSPKLREHSGNVQCRELIDKLYHLYSAPNTSKLQKTKMNHAIVQTIRSKGGRFLKASNPSNTLWIEVNKTEARRIVASRFRNMKRRNRTGGGRGPLIGSFTL